MNWVDCVLLVIVALSGIHGLRLGAAMQVLPSGASGSASSSARCSLRRWPPGARGQRPRRVVALVVVVGRGHHRGRLGRLLGARSGRLLHRLRLGPVDVGLRCGRGRGGGAHRHVAGGASCWQHSRYTEPRPGRCSSRASCAPWTTCSPPSRRCSPAWSASLSTNGFPVVFAGLPPAAAAPGDPAQRPRRRAPRWCGPRARRSRSSGAGCGVIQEGSGFVVAPGLVVTNAHVVAGIPSPDVIDASRAPRHHAWSLFDPRLDIAVLRVPGLTDPAPARRPAVVGRGTTGVVLGYPEGGPLTTGRPAWPPPSRPPGSTSTGTTQTTREVYQLDAVVQPGNSGGPLVASGDVPGMADGTVIGVVFARSTANTDVGYALAMPAVQRRRGPGPGLGADGGHGRLHLASRPRRRVATRGADRRLRMSAVALRIEDYGIIGDTHTAALVGRDGSIDWLCLPRFDSDACFAKLLGDDENGYWRIAPVADDVRGRAGATASDTLVLETEFETADRAWSGHRLHAHPRGPPPGGADGRGGAAGTVDMRMDLVIRFGYGSMVPWVRRSDGLLVRRGRARRPGAVDAGRHPRRGHDHGGRVHRVGGRAHPLRPHLVSPPTRCRRARSTPASPSTTPRRGGRTGPRRAPSRASGATPSCARSSP